MKQRFLKWLFKNNRAFFEDLITHDLKNIYKKHRVFFEGQFIRDLVGQIPKEVNDDALNFLAQGKERLTKWLLWQAYILNRQMLDPNANREKLFGMMIWARVILKSLEERVTLKAETPTPESEKEKKKDPLVDVAAFSEGIKKMLETKTHGQVKSVEKPDSKSAGEKPKDAKGAAAGRPKGR